MRRLGDPWFNRLGAQGYPWGGGAGAGAVRYLLLARFNAADQGYADAQVLDSAALGVEIGQLTVVEVDGTVAIVSNELVWTASGTPAWNELGVYSPAFTKSLGLTLLGTKNLDGNQHLVLSWQDVASVSNAAWVYLFYFRLDVDVQARANLAPTEIPVVFTYSLSTDYEMAIVLGGYDVNGVPWRNGETASNYLYGAAWYIRGSSFADWTLLWRTAIDNTATLYVASSTFGEDGGNLDDLRVPDVDLSAVLQPNNLSLFTAANGTSLDAITPEVGGTWTERNGDFDIQTNRANISVASGARDVATVPATVADTINDVVIRKTNAADSGEFGHCLRYTDNNNFWMVHADLGANQIEIVERNAGVETLRGSAAIVLTFGTDYDVRAIADGQTIDAFLDGGNKATYGAAALNENVAVHGIVGDGTSETFDNYATYPRTSSVYDSRLNAV